MTSDRRPVIVGIDGTPAAIGAVRWATGRAVREGVPLHLVRAYELPRGFPSGATEERSVLDVLRREGMRLLAVARATAIETDPAVIVGTEIVAMPPATGLLGMSRDASVLVLGNRGRNVLTGLLVGSTSLALAGRAHCPVVLVRDGDHGSPATGPVVVGVDGTGASEAAVAFAFAEAAAQDAPLVAVHAYAESVFEAALAGDNEPPDWTLQHGIADEVLAERLAGWQEKYPEVRVERDVVRDRPTRALRRHARTARLVVVGRRGHGGVRDLVLGSTSQHLLHHAASPVAVVRTETTE